MASISSNFPATEVAVDGLVVMGFIFLLWGLLPNKGVFSPGNLLRKPAYCKNGGVLLGKAAFSKINWPIVAPMFDTLLFIYVFALVVAS